MKRSPLHPFFLFLVLALSACQSMPLQGPEKGKKPPSQIDYLNTRLSRLEQIVDRWEGKIEDTEKSNRQFRADHAVYIEDIRQEIRTLKGQIDVLRHEIETQREETRRFKEDVDLRISELEKGSSSPTQKHAELSGASPKERSSVTVDDITRYNQILRLIRDQKDYDQAIIQFDQFLKEHPKSSLAANAQYWKGESYFAKEDFAKSIKEFQKVIDSYPKSEKVCAARLKQGYAFLARDEKDKARIFLVEVTKKCPNTREASKAQKKLTAL